MHIIIQYILMIKTKNITLEDKRTVVAEVCRNFLTRKNNKTGIKKTRQNILTEGFLSISYDSFQEQSQTPNNASMNRMQRENIQECSMCKIEEGECIELKMSD